MTIFMSFIVVAIVLTAIVDFWFFLPNLKKISDLEESLRGKNLDIKIN